VIFDFHVFTFLWVVVDEDALDVRLREWNCAKCIQIDVFLLPVICGRSAAFKWVCCLWLLCMGWFHKDTLWVLKNLILLYTSGRGVIVAFYAIFFTFFYFVIIALFRQADALVYPANSTLKQWGFYLSTSCVVRQGKCAPWFITLSDGRD
jgi:hypothetical protein